jgi:excisionase family DNA binding protein
MSNNSIDNPKNSDVFADDPLLSVQEAADYCKVRKSTINKKRREKSIPCIKAFGDIRFRRSDLNKFIQNGLSWGLQPVEAS